MKTIPKSNLKRSLVGSGNEIAAILSRHLNYEPVPLDKGNACSGNEIGANTACVCGARINKTSRPTAVDHLRLQLLALLDSRLGGRTLKSCVGLGANVSLIRVIPY